MLKYEVLTIKQNTGLNEVFIHPIIIHNNNDLILCDACFPGQVEQIKNELKKYNFTINDITKAVITHHDHDHIGSLKELKRKNKKIEVIASEVEADFISGKKISLRLLQAEEYNKTLTEDYKETGNQFRDYLKTIENCEIDRTISADNEIIIEGLKVISTPGHTPGHISLFLEDQKILIAGDALAIENNKLVIANPEFTLDMNKCIQSIKKIQKMTFNKIICYHGGVIENNINLLLNQLILNSK